MTDYEQAMVNATTQSNQTLQKGAGVPSSTDMILKEIEGLQAKMRWDHVSKEQIQAWQARIDDLQAILNG